MRDAMSRDTVWASEAEAAARREQQAVMDAVSGDDYEFEMRVVALRAEGRKIGGNKHEEALMHLWAGMRQQLGTTTSALQAIEYLDPGMLGTVGEYIETVQLLARQGLGG